MSKVVRVLVVEDRAVDAELVIRELRRAGFEPEWERVETEQAFCDHLQTGLDLILSDYELPSFNGLRALELLKQSGLDIPFILVSGTIGEETAVAAIKRGAADYLLKDRLTRLGAAATHALNEARLRREQRRVDLALRTTQVQLQRVLELSPAVLYTMKLEGDHVIVRVGSENVTRLLGVLVAETLSPGWWLGQLHPDDRDSARASVGETTAHGTSFNEYRLRHKDGTYRWVADHRRLVRDEDGRPGDFVGAWTEITERKRAERALEKISERVVLLAAIVESSDDAIISTDCDGIVTTWNAGASSIFGYSADEMVGATMARLIPADKSSDEERVLDKVKRGDSVEHFETQRRCRDGRLLEVSVGASPIRDVAGNVIGMSKVTRDISAQKQSSVALRASEQRFKALFEQAAVGVALVDAGTGRFVQVNQRFCAIVGRSAPELLEQLTFSAIAHPQDAADSWDLTRQLLAGPSREFTEERHYARKDGGEVWATVTMSPMWAPGEPPDFCIAVLQDITERKQLEGQFRQAQKMEAIGTLAGGIAHDFNNVLAAINGFAELSRLRLKDNPEVREYLGAVLQASARATDLIRQILTFSRQQKPERLPIQLQPVVTEALKLLRASIPSTIEFEVSLKSAPMVLADATQIHQMLMNLGTNAWHAMRDRAGKLCVTLERIVLDASQVSLPTRLHAGVYAHVSVRDTGCGMDAATLRRIFEPFFTTKPVGEGTGLGLSVVHGIMAGHDGAVTVCSELGSGTVFHLYFPAFDGASSAEAAVEGAVPRGHGERILFVDDEELLVRLGEEVLTELGYQVEIATESAVALAMVRANPQRFSLVVTDQTMPRMTGVELASELLRVRSDLPIILMTGYALALTPARIKAAGIRQLLLKPTTIQSLGSAVHTALFEVVRL